MPVVMLMISVLIPIHLLGMAIGLALQLSEARTMKWIRNMVICDLCAFTLCFTVEMIETRMEKNMKIDVQITWEPNRIAHLRSEMVREVGLPVFRKQLFPEDQTP